MRKQEPTVAACISNVGKKRAKNEEGVKLMRKQEPTVAACISNVGKKRAKNEDDFYIYGWNREEDSMLKPIVFRRNKMDETDSPWQFYAVFDGMGGGNFGEVASQTAARGAKNYIEDITNVHPYDITVSLNSMCLDLNKMVYKTANNLGTNTMGTTLVSLFFYQGMFWVCNLGDSKAFILRKGNLYQLSKDHTDELEMKKHHISGRKPSVTQYLGIDPAETKLVPYIRSAKTMKDDVFLICSDGLTDMVSIETIKSIISSSNGAKECAMRLMDAALNNGGSDNITIIVLA